MPPRTTRSPSRNTLFTLAVMLGVANLTFSAVLSILVLFAQDVLGLGGAGYGILLASAGVGRCWGP